jgi:hypothetical protein
MVVAYTPQSSSRELATRYLRFWLLLFCMNLKFQVLFKVSVMFIHPSEKRSFLSESDRALHDTGRKKISHGIKEEAVIRCGFNFTITGCLIPSS